MAKLINGNGNPAVYAAEDADWFAAIMGNQTSITGIGEQFRADQADANTIEVFDGVIITKEGRRIQLDANAVDLFEIPTGVPGTTSYYIIGYHLYNDENSNQFCEVFTQKMDTASETIPEDTFRGGADEVFVSLYRITQDGLTITDIDLLLPTIDDIAQLNLDLTGIISSLNGVYKYKYLSDCNIDIFTENGIYWLNGYVATTTGTFPQFATKSQHWIFINSNGLNQILIPISQSGIFVRHRDSTSTSWLGWEDKAAKSTESLWTGSIYHGQSISIPSLGALTTAQIQSKWRAIRFIIKNANNNTYSYVDMPTELYLGSNFYCPFGMSWENHITSALLHVIPTNLPGTATISLLNYAGATMDNNVRLIEVRGILR